MDFAPRFDPKEAEPRIYKMWEEKGYFTARADSPKPPYTIVIPPPNVTGALHIGHALNNSLQDLLVRWKRMDGFEALYLPGTDHAGIATQRVVEKDLKKEGLNRKQMGREAFLKRVWEWKDKYGATILSQLRRLGCSCDWSRTRFTMDESYSLAIRTVFVSLFKKGLIYRGLRPINWCFGCQTALSDLEVKKPEDGGAPGKLWHIKYPVESGFITVATTRPETMLGDTAVMVHPADLRYAKFVGKKVRLPFVNREIPIITDEAVDMAFGSGAVKVTPAHDVTDFEVGVRHMLPAILVIDPAGRMNDEAGPFKGLPREEARKQVLEKLREMNLLEKEEDHPSAAGTCDRCGTTVEPYLSEQWFVRMKSLAAPAITSVKTGEVKFHPDRWSKVYLDWMENIQDWCISRQLWWGHRIPVWYCGCEEAIASVEPPKACPKCGKTDLRQDEDVLDTWFSSALWPFATLGWPAVTDDLDKFYPTQTLVTDRGIIFLWVARMIMSGLEFTGDKPFDDVIIHATILDDAGQRMSKSKGTGIDPLEMIDAYGADPLRFALALVTTGTQDFRFGKNLSVQRTEQARNFITKLWNASRFVAMNAAGAAPGLPIDGLAVEDRWILSALNRTVAEVTRALEAFEFGRAADALYGFTWDGFCDWYIELTKRRTDEAVKRVLVHTVTTILRMLHPMCPFVTEELWQRYRAAGFVKQESIMLAPWPEADEQYLDSRTEESFAVVFETVKGLREVRARYGIVNKEKLAAKVEAKDPAQEQFLSGAGRDLVRHMANLDILEVASKLAKPDGAARWTGGGLLIYVDVVGKFDKEKELVRSAKEIASLEAARDRSKVQLANEAFLKARPEMAEKMKVELGQTERKIQELRDHIGELKELS